MAAHLPLRGPSGFVWRGKRPRLPVHAGQSKERERESECTGSAGVGDEGKRGDPGDGLTARHAKRYGREDLLRPHHVRHLSTFKLEVSLAAPTRNRKQLALEKTFVERRYDGQNQASPWGSPRARSPPWPTVVPTDKKGRLGAEGRGGRGPTSFSRSSRRHFFWRPPDRPVRASPPKPKPRVFDERPKKDGVLESRGPRTTEGEAGPRRRR